MKKFQLNFQDLQLEKKFQKEKLDSIQFPLIQSLCFGGIVIIIIMLVNQYQSKMYHNLYQAFSLLIAFIICLLISRIKKKLSCNFLIIIYFAIILQEYKMEPDFDSYDGFLKGCNFMIVHAIIGFGLDFVPSTLVNILYTIIRILTNYFNSGQLLPEQYTYTIAVAIAYSYLIYKIEYLHRSAFLFKFKDDNWESLIPKLITKPFVILRFRKEILQFQQISSNKTYGFFINEENTKQFINQSQVRQTNNSLLLYLYKIHEEYQNKVDIKDIEFCVDLIFQEKKIKLHLLLNKFEQLNFIMILESEDIILKNQKLQHKFCMNHLQNNHLKQLSMSQNILRKFLKSKNTSLIIQYKLSLFQYQILKGQKILFNDKLINLSQFYKKVLTQLQQYYQITYLIQDNMAQITSKQIHILFIFELIKNANPSMSIIIKMYTEREKMKLIFQGINKLQKSQVFNLCYKTLIEEYLQNQQSIINDQNQPIYLFSINLQSFLLIKQCRCKIVNKKNLIRLTNRNLTLIEKILYQFLLLLCNIFLIALKKKQNKSNIFIPKLHITLILFYNIIIQNSHRIVNYQKSINIRKFQHYLLLQIQILSRFNLTSKYFNNIIFVFLMIQILILSANDSTKSIRLLIYTGFVIFSIIFYNRSDSKRQRGDLSISVFKRCLKGWIQQFINLMNNLYVRISLICGALSTSYFVNQYFEETYFRRLRFIRKLARTYFKQDDGTELFDDQIIGNVVARSDGMHLHFGNMKQYVAQKFSTPTAIIYVQKVEAIKKIVQKASKYGFKVTTMDVDSIEDYKQQLQNNLNLSQKEIKRLTYCKYPFLIINLRKVLHKEYDQQTQIVKVGVGNRVQDVNQFLAQYGRRIPLSGQQRLFTILSDNSTPLDSVEYDNLNQIVTGLVAISPTSHQLQTETPTASPIINQLFIGQQHRFGIVYEVSLKTESLELPVKQEINLDKRYVSKTNLYYLFDSLIKLSQQQRQKIQFLYDCYSNQYKIIQQGTQNLPDLKQTLDNVVDKYVTRQLWNSNNNNNNNNNNNKKNIQTDNNNTLNEEMSLQLKYQLSSSQLLSCLLQLKELQLKQQQQQFLVQVDFKTGFLTVNINNHLPSNEKLQMVKSFTHYISNRKGRFIQCNDKLINRMLKLETYPMELGLNSMRLEHKFAELIDKNKVMFHEFLQHTELDEQIS